MQCSQPTLKGSSVQDCDVEEARRLISREEVQRYAPRTKIKVETSNCFNYFNIESKLQKNIKQRASEYGTTTIIEEKSNFGGVSLQAQRILRIFMLLVIFVCLVVTALLAYLIARSDFVTLSDTSASASFDETTPSSSLAKGWALILCLCLILVLFLLFVFVALIKSTKIISQTIIVPDNDFQSPRVRNHPEGILN